MENNYNSLTDLCTYLQTLGFEDITASYPIHFAQQLHVTWKNIYALSFVFRRLNDIKTILYVGEEPAGFTHVIIESQCNDCDARTCDQMPTEYAKERIKFLVDQNEQYLKRLHNQGTCENIKFIR